MKKTANNKKRKKYVHLIDCILLTVYIITATIIIISGIIILSKPHEKMDDAIRESALEEYKARAYPPARETTGSYDSSYYEE